MTSKTGDRRDVFRFSPVFSSRFSPKTKPDIIAKRLKDKYDF